MVGRLPQPLTRFIGREWELRELEEVLARDGLLALGGGGGCGKTRLAIELARAQTQFGTDRVWFVDLAPIQSQEVLEAWVAAATGARADVAGDLTRAVTARLSEAPCLLVLDTCEHLVHACADFVASLLAGSRPVTVLATSRQTLKVPGELRWVVPSLSSPAADGPASIAEVQKSESVQLFVDRGRLVRPNFNLDTRNVSAVASICRQLDGLPRAIELASAWTGMLAPDQIAARLTERFDLLKSSATVTSRHQTLERTVDWSFDLLSPPAQLLLKRLSVFASSFDVAACERVCADELIQSEDVLHRLAELVDQSIVEVLTDDRYRLPDTIREYARARTESPAEIEALQKRHASHFVQVAEDAYRQLRGPGRRPWQERLDIEAANIRKALEWADSHDASMALRLAYLVAPFHMVRMSGSDVQQADAWLARALSKAPKNSRVLGWALTERGWLAWRQGDIAAAERHWTDALKAFRAAADDKGMGETLTQLGEIAGTRGDLTRSKRLLGEGLAHSQNAGDAWMVAYARLYLGILAIRLKQPAAAIEPLTESLDGWSAVGDQLMVAYPTALLGLAALELRDLAAARSRFEAAFQLTRSHRYEWGNAALLQMFAALCVALRDPSRALLLMSAADSIFDRIRSKPSPFLEPTMTAWLKRARESVTTIDRDALATKGRELTVEQAAELVRSIPAVKRKPPGGLTEREIEVARLVAQGFASKDIARQLNISARTAETHMDHVRAKRGVRSRAQVAAWVTSQRFDIG